MFAGIIEKLGEVVSLRSGRLTVRAKPWAQLFTIGESIAVNGVCLTLTDFKRDSLRFDILKETLKKTNLGSRKRGGVVNLERSLRVGDTIGGHFVTGHVDGTGRVRSLKRCGKDWILEVDCPPRLARGIVEKGSIAINGISLTVVDLSDGSFSVHLIPHTWKNTDLSRLRVNDKVNLETDMLGKYVQRLATSSLAGEAT